MNQPFPPRNGSGRLGAFSGFLVVAPMLCLGIGSCGGSEIDDTSRGGASGAGGTSGGGASGTSGTSGTAGEAGMSGGDGGAAGSGIGGTSGATGGGSGSAGESGAGGAGGGETPCDPTMGPSEGRVRDRRGVRCVRLARR